MSDDDGYPEEWHHVSGSGRHRWQWVDENYEVLEELYHSFLDHGRAIFGDSFFQLGGFHTFTAMVYENTILNSNRL